MATRIRTLNFLPEIFQTPTNSQFLSATLDQIVNPPNTNRIQGYVGSKFGYGINAKDYYVTEPSKERVDYQLEPGVVFTKDNESTAYDFISYPGIVNGLQNQGGIVNNNDRLFESQFYSWDSFSNLDKLINFNYYYWLPEGPPAVTVSTETVFTTFSYVVVDTPSGYLISGSQQATGSVNPTITLLRGGTYTFTVNQATDFWIQGEPGVTGYSPTQPNLNTREILGVTNNGIDQGILTFSVPLADAQSNLNFPGNNLVDIVSTIPFSQLNGQPVVGFAGVDGITSLNGLTVMFYNTGVVNELGYVQQFFNQNNYDVNGNLITPLTIDITNTNSVGNVITCNSTANLTVGQTITFTGTEFGNLTSYTGLTSSAISAGSFNIGQKYIIQTSGTTDWISIGLTETANVTASISGTVLTVSAVNTNPFSIGQTITGTGVASGTVVTDYNEINGTYTVSISQTVSSTTILGYTILGSLFTATGIGSGTGTALLYDPEIFYVTSILNGTAFTIAAEEPYIDYGGTLVIGQKYVITSLGSTNFILSGAASNTVGTVFTATNVGLGTGSARQVITAGAFNPGSTYTITSIGTTDFTLIGASSNTIGLSFTATGVGAGNGTAYLGSNITLTTATGTMTGYINQGLLEEGYYTTVDDLFYTITYIGDPATPTISLIPYNSIPTNQKITANFGTTYNGRNFYKNTAGTIILIPYLSAPLTTLYYQDGTFANKVGVIKIIESNTSNRLNILTEILGKDQYTSSTGIVFTNGLKVEFQGDIFPSSYLEGSYYVEGVGTSIQLINTNDLVVPEAFTENLLLPWDTVGWDFGNWDGTSNIPIKQDYITISRNSLSLNPWSRSNRWFHIDVINATATYNNNPNIVTEYATESAKAKRPIIEFYPNLKLFDFGTFGKAPVDFVDERTTDAFSEVAGQQNYYPDVIAYTDYTGSIATTNYTVSRTISATTTLTNHVTVSSTNGFRVNDLIVITSLSTFGGLSYNTDYYVQSIVNSTTLKLSTTVNGDPINLTTGSGTMNFDWTPRSTEITIAADDVTGVLTEGNYITDSTNLLPNNSYIVEITGTTTFTITVSWPESSNPFFTSTSVASFVTTDTTVDNYALFDGSRIVFANDTNLNVRNKIYISKFQSITGTSTPVITLIEALDGTVYENDQTVSKRGYNNTGIDFYFDGNNWIKGQQKTDINQAPLFDIFDNNGISFGNRDIYVGSNFNGCKLFSYSIGNGIDDIVLGFPIKYSNIDNIGDISFDVNLNSDTFDYVTGSTPINQNVSKGYVYNYSTRELYERMLGWQTAKYPSVQYQLFQFNYVLGDDNSFLCDVAANIVDSWPNIRVFINNNLVATDNFTTLIGSNSTTVTIDSILLLENTVIQILILSDQVSLTAYYTTPINLNNNPFNVNITSVNVGEIRGQYQSIFYNNTNLTGQVFGSNNFRDLGNLVPYGDRIIQNSASLVLPGVFLRKQDCNLFDALLFNSKQYILFKTLLVYTVNNSNYEQRYNPSEILDDALDQISASKTDSMPFFWSDMLPGKAAYITNNYTFANSLSVSVYPLSKIYDFTSANYNGLLVYLQRTANNIVNTTQLIINQDYTVSATAPSLTITLQLQPGDTIIVKEYNQTYGSYVPNTPTKLGLYPSFIPEVVLDTTYSTPTYFIKGHDGSYTKLYGDYDSTNNLLIDFRDQALLEFERRIYNNLKINDIIPIQSYEITPGFFRDTGYSYNEWLEIYSVNFLNWIGQNRLDYESQIYNKNNQFTFNYDNSGIKLNNKPIEQGYWRGVYTYFYDTSTPNLTPWEMIGYKNQPNWWTDRYGPAPYTSNNLILWEDMANGIDYNNGNPIVINELKRPELLQVLPVDSYGNLLSPFDSIVGNFNERLFKNDWKVGDDGPVEFSYRRSSTYPFDLMKILALTKPAKFFNLGVDVDNYKYNLEFNQYLVNDRSHLIISDIEIYGNGTAKTSYINWIVDYQKQVGIPATSNITNILKNLDVRLIYRLAGFSDKTFLKFFVEKGSPNSTNASLLIPDESYSLLLYDNVPFDKIIYSGIIVQIDQRGFTVFGNSQTQAYFNILKPKNNGVYDQLTVEDITVRVPRNFFTTTDIVPYGQTFYSIQELCIFIKSYGAYLESKGMKFDTIENGLEINWNQMILEFLYFVQNGWEVGTLITLNPAAVNLQINRENAIVQPLTYYESNFVVNENLYPIALKDLAITREETFFSVQALNQGDSIGYGQFNLNSIEHGIVFDNITLFNDTIYNVPTGLRQIRIFCRGTKTAEWNGTLTPSGFILNQDNIQEWNSTVTYTKGQIVKYKTKYYTAIKIVQPKIVFDETDWKRTDYDEIQKGLLPNSSTRSAESLLYYDINNANLENEADLLAFSLVGYRPRNYLALADLTDITQINVYLNLIKNKGTRNATYAFKGANLPQGGIDYEIYENWAIKSGEYGGVLNNNFIQLRLQENDLTGNPCTLGLTNGNVFDDVEQTIPLNKIYNYARPITDPNILATIPVDTPNKVFPDAGYVNFNDVKMSAFYASLLNGAVDKNGLVVPLSRVYVNDYIWLAKYLSTWQVYTPVSNGRVVFATNNLNGSVTLTFSEPHNLSLNQLIAIINFDPTINGYFIVKAIVNIYKIIINLTLSPQTTTVSGQGIVFKFQTQRVSKPSDINDLPLLNYEFVKNRVWVDQGSSGNWEVYQKSVNYSFDTEIIKTNTDTFGSAVAYTDKLGYLIGDQDAGKVYRYTYNDLTQSYDLNQTLTQTASFGASISYSDNIFVISQPTGTSRVYVYELPDSILTDDLTLYQTAISALGGSSNWGSSTAISGDKNWIYISAVDLARVYVYRKSQVTDEYEYITYFNVGGLTSSDNFGYSLSTDYYGDTVIVGAPNVDYSGTITDWGKTYVFTRSLQNIESQFNSDSSISQTLQLAWTPTTITSACSATAVTTNRITCTDTTGFVVDMPVIFSGTIYSGSEILPNTIYYIHSIVSGTQFTIKTTRAGITSFALGTSSGTGMTVNVQSEPLYVSVNGELVEDSNYGVIGSTLNYVGNLTAGDIITVSGSNFTLNQTLTSTDIDTVGIRFGNSVSTTTHATEVIVGSPFIISNNVEGAVYRFTNAGGRFGSVSSTTEVNVTSVRKLLINGYLVFIPVGLAEDAADAINASLITNVIASAENNYLTISIVNSDLTQPNEKLILASTDSSTFTELGIDIYSLTQTINCPHPQGRSQFGTTVKFNELGSFVASAPVGTRYTSTTFDFSDDVNLDNDTVFDNNATQFVDSFPNAGAVYMFDYIPNYNETINNVGQFIYAQSINDTDLTYGSQPYYGTALDFNQNRVIVGTPNFEPNITNGKVTTFINQLGVQDWSILRQSPAIVDINKVYNVQIFSAQTNNTLINLDYIDPLQGKILGAARQNIDVISNVDPANYNRADQQRGLFWGSDHEGDIWLNTSSMAYVNYHQNDVVYDSKYWGELFPGSFVGVYSWISSNVPPIDYQGPGVVYDVEKFSIQYILNANNQIQPIYFFWVQNTNIIFYKRGKTLADSIIANYIRNSKNSGISYFAPIKQNVYALYNSGEYINANDSILSFSYATGNNDEAIHNQYNLIRSNFADDFLPGVPKFTGVVSPNQQVNGTQLNNSPQYLYDRYLDSFSGVDEVGEIVPNPYLPKAVQFGILARPRQSFFIDRLLALKNYITYANTVMSQFPIVELRPNLSFLFTEGAINPSDSPNLFFNTTDYWQYKNWWAVGYSDSTRSALQVPLFADLSTLNVNVGTIVTVNTNSEGRSETYILSDTLTWNRIGLQNGTIEIKAEIYDYQDARLGWGDNFWDTTPYDYYPSEETRYIIRALNEQIYTNEFLIFRNKSLILMFEYIQSESLENQNYLPWLNKTSLIDVSHKIRELRPIEVFQSDNQEFLSAYLNEVKPYHVVIKDFLFTYTGNETFEGDITDFDLPSKYNNTFKQFITPQIVYQSPDANNEYTPSNSIWLDPSYNQWYQNYGLSIVGQLNYEITTLQSYISLSTTFFAVDNAFGFPINGYIKIGNEIIGYSNVDRNLQVISGLTRGVNGTPIETHIPNELIFIDLPPVIILNGSRGYTEPPKVSVYIDTTIYPDPKEAAELEVVMALDSVSYINVVNPGIGYVVTPEIVIDPAITITLTDQEVNTTNNTIRSFSSFLQTGDEIQYKEVEGNPIQGLQNNQWYYVNILENTPLIILALYSNYGDSLKDENRIKFYSKSIGTFSLNLGAKAFAVTISSPVRENNITLRFDRTTYNSDLIDWRAGQYYGSYYAGSYSNSESVSSSSIQLASTSPPIESILASAQGVAFEILNVENIRVIDYTSFIRYVSQTLTSSNIITLILQDDGSGNPNASGGTLGFYIGMPIKFVGNTGTSNIVNETTYYIAEIVSLTEFKISASDSGSPVLALGNFTVGPAGLKCYVGQIIDTAKLTVYYPGILTATATSEGTNKITVPLNLTGTGGTNNFYTGMTLFFTGTVFGNIIENEIYYVTTVCDNQTFTISKTNDPLRLDVLETIASTDSIRVDGTYQTLTVNDPIIFTDFLFTAGDFVIGQEYVIEFVGTTDFTLIGATYNTVGTRFTASGVGTGTGTASSLEFGNLVAGDTYYVISTIGNDEFVVATSLNGSTFTLIDSVGTGYVTSQINTVDLTTDTGSMIVNVNLPVSPGQVNGQLFTMYQTSEQYTGITGSETSLQERVVKATLGNRTGNPGAEVDRVLISQTGDGLENFYINMPVQFEASIGGLSAGAPGYYVTDYGTTSVTVISTSASITAGIVTGSISSTVLTVTAVTSGVVVPGAILSGTGITSGTTVLDYIGGSGGVGTYLITPSQAAGSTTINVTISALTCQNSDDTNKLYVDMPVLFSGQSLGGIEINLEYYVRSIIDDVRFSISSSPGDTATTLTNESGIMVGTGDPWIQVSTSIGGGVVTLSDDTNSTNLTQTPTSTPVFDVSYILGGYRVVLNNAGTGYAVDNVITIPGTQLGGTSPTNDLVLTVNAIDVISYDQINDILTSNGEITSVICNGTPVGLEQSYYLKVTGDNTFEVYSNSLMTVPVSGLTFPYSGIVSTNVLSTTASNDIELLDVTDFNLYDRIVFTGDVVGGLIRGAVYYIYSIDSINNLITISTVPNDVSTLVTVTNTSTEFTVAKVGDFALLPEPFIFNQSIVKYNNNVYICIISNNDPTFVIGKWELLTSGDRRLNALDRINGYYRPTVNMPGLDLTQLVDGITYPGSTYKGNAFEPDQQFAVDVIIPSQQFYPTEITLKAIVFGENDYYAPLYTPNEFGLAVSDVGNSWTIAKLANSTIEATDIIYANGYYLITTTNTATPIYRSSNGSVWTTNGFFTPYGATPYDLENYDMTSLSIAAIRLNGAAYGSNVFIAVGDSIVRSTDTYSWTEVFTFTGTAVSQFNGVTYVNIPNFTGFIAVGKTQTIISSNYVDINCIAYSNPNGIFYTQTPVVTYQIFNSIVSSPTEIVVVGNNGSIYTSLNGINYTGVTETQVLNTNGATNEMVLLTTTSFTVGDEIRFLGEGFGGVLLNTSYWVKTISTSTNSITLSDDSGLVSTTTLTTASPSRLVIIYKYGFENLNKVIYANSFYTAIGDTGTILTSNDGLTWTTQTSGVSENLYGITYNSTTGDFIAVGDNNTIIISSDNCVTWTSTSLFVQPISTYTLDGGEFLSGFGPEELVPGVVSDNLAMIVTTRPGTNWPVTEYAHVGYNVVSIEVSPTTGIQTTFSFEYVVQTPAQIAVYLMDATNQLCTALYESNGDYTIDWIDLTVTIPSPLNLNEKLRIDVYEVGNGDQLVKANTFTDPIRINTTTGFNEIFVNCAYSGTIFSGGGIIQQGTEPKTVTAYETDDISNAIFCLDVTDFILNDPITFQGAVFGGLAEDTTYYVKTISYVSKTITVSTSITGGLAGPTFDVSSATGTMTVIVQLGTGAAFYSTPIIYHNGNKLQHGVTGTVTRTNGDDILAANLIAGKEYTITDIGTTDFTLIGAASNTVGLLFTCSGPGTGTGTAAKYTIQISTTTGLIVNDPVVFSDTMFGPNITPQTVYYVKNIWDMNEFTVSTTPGGAILPLDSYTGGATYITNDYTFGIQPNGVSAKIIFTSQYDNTIDYITYTLFGQTTPAQYGYTIPETQLITADGTVGPFTLNNYVGGDNPDNAIVEVNGLRITPSDYTINFSLNEITFTSAPTIGDNIAVTSYNLTDRQYFYTMSGVTGKTVSLIVNVQNSLSPYIAVVQTTATTTGTDYITCSSTTDFVVGQTVQYKGTGFGNILTDGTVYYIRAIISPTQYTIEDENGNIISLTTATGLMLTYVGGLEAVRITTAQAHNFVTNDLVRIDGVGGSTQLNDNIYYVHVINSVQFDLYEFNPNSPSTDYDPAAGAVNYPITTVSSFTSGGYAWLNQTYMLDQFNPTATDSTDNSITISSTSDLVINNPIVFMEVGSQIGDTLMGGIVAGTIYYIKEVLSVTKFTMSEEREGTEFVLTTDTGSIIMNMWEQFNVDRLWVTVDGYRVPSSKLRLNPGNQISILTEINSAQEVIITSMVPSATPNELTYLLKVDSLNQGVVYRDNTNSRTWLTEDLYNTSETINVDDVTKITDVLVQNSIAPAAINGYVYVGLIGDKNSIVNVSVYNNTQNAIINSTNYEIVIESLAPKLKITSGAYINTGDSLTITILEGNLILINGEEIKFTTVNTANNTITGISRGVNGTGIQTLIPKYSEVYSELARNEMPIADYSITWNPIPGNLNPTLGDPLQLADTSSAIFLREDQT